MPGTTSYRNVQRFPEAATSPGVCVLRIDAPITFVSAAAVRRRVLDHASGGTTVLVLDASGVNDVDATGADMLDALLDELDDLGVQLHLAEVKGPVRDVLRRAGLWSRLAGRLHASNHDAVEAATGGSTEPTDPRCSAVDEHQPTHPWPTATQPLETR